MNCKKCKRVLKLTAAHKKAKYSVYCECQSYVRPLFDSVAKAKNAINKYIEKAKSRQTFMDWWEGE